MAVFHAYTIEQAAKVAKVSPRRVRYWAESGVLVPSVMYDTETSPRHALYSFRDLVGLRTLAILRDRHGLSLQSLRQAGSYLSEHSNAPWSDLRLWVRGKDLLFYPPPSDVPVSATKPGQAVFEIDLEPVSHDTERASDALRRSQADIGQTERRRKVLGNELVIKGTRVPVESVLELSDAGYSIEAIVRAFPSLVTDDVTAVLTARRSQRVA